MGALILLLACAEDDPVVDVAEGFHVTAVVPEDGAADVFVDQIPELRFSDPSLAETCTTDTVRLDGLHEDGTVAFAVELALVEVDRGSKLQLEHAIALRAGWTYAITVQGGEDGCTDTTGSPILPFGARFSVP